MYLAGNIQYAASGWTWQGAFLGAALLLVIAVIVKMLR